MISSEITEEQDEKDPDFINPEVEKQSIRRLIKYQKSLYWSSSSSSSLSSMVASCSSSVSSSSRSSSSLLNLMKSGNTSLRRLFDMEHTSLLTHLQDYSGSPITKSIPLWESDTNGEVQDPWAFFKQTQMFYNVETSSTTGYASDGSFMDKDYRFKNRKMKRSNLRLTRTKSFRRLPGFRLRLRLKRLKIMICGRFF